MNQIIWFGWKANNPLTCGRQWRTCNAAAAAAFRERAGGNDGLPLPPHHGVARVTYASVMSAIGRGRAWVGCHMHVSSPRCLKAGSDRFVLLTATSSVAIQYSHCSRSTVDVRTVLYGIVNWPSSASRQMRWDWLRRVRLKFEQTMRADIKKWLTRKMSSCSTMWIAELRGSKENTVINYFIKEFSL